MSDEEQQEQAEQPEEFQNRAARRAAKHKKHTQGLATAQTSEQQHGRGAAPARKSFTSRRSGG